MKLTDRELRCQDFQISLDRDSTWLNNSWDTTVKAKEEEDAEGSEECGVNSKKISKGNPKPKLKRLNPKRRKKHQKLTSKLKPTSTK